jgi:hypothetical protein
LFYKENHKENHKEKKEKKENKKERQICVITNVYYTLWIEVLASTKQPERDGDGSVSSICN